jgi:hypothetical protein
MNNGLLTANNILRLLMTVVVMCFLSACDKNSHIPNDSVLVEIPEGTLENIYNAEENTTFPHGKFKDIYPDVRHVVNDMSDMEKANISHLTYRKLVDALDVMLDSAATKQIDDEWQKTYDEYLQKAKKDADDMTSQLLDEIRPALRRSYNQGFRQSVYSYIRSSWYFKYMKRMPQSARDIPDCWDYVKIIKDIYESDFDRQDVYRSAKQLESISIQYPEAHYLLEKVAAYNNEINDISSSLFDGAW